MKQEPPKVLDEVTKSLDESTTLIQALAKMEDFIVLLGWVRQEDRYYLKGEVRKSLLDAFLQEVKKYQ